MAEMDYTDDTSWSPLPFKLEGQALFYCIVTIILFILYIFITTAIVFDRKRYHKTFLLTLLNFVVAYTLHTIVRYFGEVHINLIYETTKPICHTIHFVNSIAAEGAEMAIFPVFINMIVQHMMPERYERRKYRVFMIILIVVTWLVIILKEIIYRTQSIIEFQCFESKPSGLMWTEFAFCILRIILILVAIGFLLFIATTKRPVHQILGLIVAPILMGIFLCVANIMTAIYQVNAMVGDSSLSDLALANIYFRLFMPLILALLWLLNNDFRESIKRLVICSPCRNMGPEATEHELTTDIS